MRGRSRGRGHNRTQPESPSGEELCGADIPSPIPGWFRTWIPRLASHSSKCPDVDRRRRIARWLAWLVLACIGVGFAMVSLRWM